MRSTPRIALRKLPPLLGVLLLTSACTGDPTPPAATTTAPDVHFDSITITLADKPFTLEIADTPAQRERGLMFRKSMPADHGMIFVFTVADTYAFWMKNTEISLDILFLDATGKIIDIRTMKAEDETNIGPSAPALFAVELNAGAAATLHLHTGDLFPVPDKLLKPLPHTDEK